MIVGVLARRSEPTGQKPALGGIITAIIGFVLGFIAFVVGIIAFQALMQSGTIPTS